MTALDVALLDAALTHAATRLQAMLTNDAPSSPVLLAIVLDGQPTQAQLDQLAPLANEVDSHRSAALSAADAVMTSLASPPQGLADVAAPCAHLATALEELAFAVTVLGAVSSAPSRGDGVRRLLQHAFRSEHTAGLVRQLGLTAAPDALAVNGTTVEFTLTNPGTVSLGVAHLIAFTDSTLTASFDWTSPTSLMLRFDTTVESDVVADAFVRKLVPGKAAATGKVRLNVGPVDGITFGPGVRHRIAIPGHLDVFGVELRDFAIELPDPSELGAATVPAFALTATIAGTVGPISATVGGVGVELDLPADAVLAGTADPLAPGVRPPDGAGLSIDAGPVRGGGYVQHAHDEYGGALELAFGPVDIKAVGLISTDPFSLVLVLSVEFTPGIQLSFGFTLNGVGGLLALERTVSTDALRAGLRDHTADSLLFPADPVKAAPHILDALDRSFPQQPGAFVVGPMLEIGWGVPISLVTAKAGVVIALTDPKVIILGLVRVALPAPDAAIVDLKAELYGEITPDHLLVLVSLENSRIAGFTLNGDFALLIAYGDQPDFAITAGGFHPHYRPPAELQGMHRVAVDLSPPALLTLRADAYFALTANSVQLGTHVHLRADLSVVSAEGHLGFDALVRWSPRFAFEIDLSVGIAVYVFGESFCGVDLALHLEGPGPWSAHGTGSVSFLFFDVDFEVGPVTWGEGDNPPPDARSPVALVAAALDDRKSWRAVAPESGDRVATLRPVSISGDTILVHPLGAFEVRQQTVPLETVIDHVGPHPVTEHRVNLADPLVGGFPAKAVSATVDRFAPGQFLQLADDEKLSRPAFEELPSGMRLNGASTNAFGSAVESDYRWDTVYPHHDFDRQRLPVWFSPVLRAMALSTSPVAVSTLRDESAYRVDRTPIALADPGTALIRSTDDLRPVDGIPSTPMTTTAACRVLADALEGGAPRGSLQLVGLGVA